jgi:hypothetical protein
MSCRTCRVYALLLRLYPRKFRDEFGEEMKATFARLLEDEAATSRAWRLVLAELVPTLAREHFQAMAETAPGISLRLRMVLRIALAVLLPLAAYIVLLGWAPGAKEIFMLSAFFGLMSAGMAVARGRGWACNIGAIAGAMAGVQLMVEVISFTETTNPNILLVAPLFAACAVTIALILATWVRVVMEGVRFSRIQGA